jgi:hypothetical protein
MLHNSQARLLDDVYLDDIPHIIHPNTAARDLAYTAQPNRIIQEWDLPQGYTFFVSRYHKFHWQRPSMAYRDTLADVSSGKVVLLTSHTLSGVLNTSGQLLNNLPFFLQSRLSELISRQIKRPVYYVRPAAPVQHAQSAKTINSKAAGRLLAAGGIYNGNPEGFRKTAEQLGGEAPSGYDQVMDNKGLLIAGASVAAGLTMGKMGVPEMEKLGGSIPKGAVANKNGNFISELKDVTQKQLDKKFKHAVDFGVTSTKKNPETLADFHDAIKSHMSNSDTFKLGSYGFVKDSNVFFNPNSNNAVVLGESGNFITGFKLYSTSAQYDNYIKNGVLR